MSPAPAPPTTVPALEELHPALWRAHQLGRPQQGVTASGFHLLDAQLPGGGWPSRVLTELLLPHAGVGELRLLAPALAHLQCRQRCVMWFDPPAQPCAWSLLAMGLDLRQLVVLNARQQLKSTARGLLPAADILWALEQALKSGHLGAAVAWLPARLPADAVRRLQLAAQAHDGPVFLLREAPQVVRAANPAAATPPSVAPLRLAMTSAGPDVLRLRFVKRRGPPLNEPLLLALPPVLSAPAAARAQALRLQQRGQSGIGALQGIVASAGAGAGASASASASASTAVHARTQARASDARPGRPAG